MHPSPLALTGLGCLWCTFLRRILLLASSIIPHLWLVVTTWDRTSCYQKCNEGCLILSSPVRFGTLLLGCIRILLLTAGAHVDGLSDSDGKTTTFIWLLGHAAQSRRGRLIDDHRYYLVLHNLQPSYGMLGSTMRICLEFGEILLTPVAEQALRITGLWS